MILRPPTVNRMIMKCNSLNCYFDGNGMVQYYSKIENYTVSLRKERRVEFLKIGLRNVLHPRAYIVDANGWLAKGKRPNFL